jgi:hypothetical protein
VAGVSKVVNAKARWVGHKLHADVVIATDPKLPVAAALDIASALETELFAHLPALEIANVRLATSDTATDHHHMHGHDRRHDPASSHDHHRP